MFTRAQRAQTVCAGMAVASVAAMLGSGGQGPVELRTTPAGAVARVAVPLASAPLARRVAQFAPGDSDGSKFRSLNIYYVGQTRGSALDWQALDLDKSLELMWARKLAIPGVTSATRKAAALVLASYRGTTQQTTTLEAYVRSADAEVRGAHAALRWGGLCAKLRMPERRCATLRGLAGRLNGRNTVAYGMTEMMPSLKGTVNAPLLDVLLRHAGEDYLNSVPALADPLLSKGFYQFTSHAVRHDASGRQGASVAAEFAGAGHGIAGSVMGLDSRAQHRAAYYFSVYNLALMVRGLSAGEYAQLAKAPLAEEQLVQFVSASHHLPTRSRAIMGAWLAGKRRANLGECFGPSLRAYAAKSVSNLRALRGWGRVA